VIDATDGKVVLAKVDIEANPGLQAAFKVQSIPAVFAMKDGAVVDGFLGAYPEPAVQQFVDGLVPSAEEQQVHDLIAVGDEAKLMLTFQSRFGRAEWLQPYTDETVKSLAQSGVKNMAVVTPGFAADCLETLEEIAVENGDIFKANGGENFAAIPCLNDGEQGMALLVHLVRRELMGWAG